MSGYRIDNDPAASVYPVALYGPEGILGRYHSLPIAVRAAGYVARADARLGDIAHTGPNRWTAPILLTAKATPATDATGTAIAPSTPPRAA